MDITKEMVEHISALSRLNLAEDEMDQLAAELEFIVRYMDILDALPTVDMEPMSHVFPLKNVLREDEVIPSPARAELLANAPAADGTAFLVPRTVE